MQILKLLPKDGAANDLFGISVAISGTTVIVGAYRDDDNGEDAGSAYLCTPPCPWDINDDGSVGTTDLLLLLSAWGPVTPDHPADFDGDGNVSTLDLLLLLGQWGACP